MHPSSSIHFSHAVNDALHWERKASTLLWYKFNDVKKLLSSRLSSDTDASKQKVWIWIWIFILSTQIQYSKNSKKQNSVDWTERLKKHLQLPYKIRKYRNTLHYNKTLKNDTCIEFRHAIKALTLLADTTSSSNLFLILTTRTEKKFWWTC